MEQSDERHAAETSSSIGCKDCKHGEEVIAKGKVWHKTGYYVCITYGPRWVYRAPQVKCPHGKREGRVLDGFSGKQISTGV